MKPSTGLWVLGGLVVLLAGGLFYAVAGTKSGSSSSGSGSGKSSSLGDVVGSIVDGIAGIFEKK